ncbi:MAG: FHA domain-containing protein [Armatimonadota bacterium]|nr:FHA domain-containing protein [Armatimonadota bacterium]MDR7449431.1 FHA domain-containing protein [Armatimonadota bacterium]MDR7458803.1 FHA domain-containing protein [Armatimonadota bacterium]MDR7480020.1 FHA domain-containing protein [Armatimonadota bacterium]MDR7488436.1 FHA domain-containing protein [Armatimonadota bacterium]
MELVVWAGRFLLLVLLYLFLAQVVRAALRDLRPPAATPEAPAAGAGLPERPPAGLPEAAARPVAASPGAALLEVVASPGTPPLGRRYPLRTGLVIGRAATSDIALPDPFVSTTHARCVVRSGRVWVEDLGSRNGTLVNGHRIGGPVALRAGDRLTVGRVTFRLVADEQQVSTAEV